MDLFKFQLDYWLSKYEVLNQTLFWKFPQKTNLDNNLCEN